MALNTLEGDNIIRQIAYLKERTAKLESYFQGTPISSMRIGRISADRIDSGTIKASTAISVEDENEVIRTIMGDRGGGNYGLSVYDENGEVVLDETKIKMQYVFSTQMESGNANWLSVVGFVTYNSTANEERNLVVRLDFVKPTNLQITNATLYYKFNDFVDMIGVQRNTNVSLYLNPSKSLITPASEMRYYRFSGTTLASGITPNADEYAGTVVFNSSQISGINNGLNYIVAQQNTSSSSNAGYCVLNLVLEGYLLTGV